MLAQREAALDSDLQSCVPRMAHSLRQALRDYRDLPSYPTTMLIRYEHGIVRKRSMIEEIRSFFAWIASEQQIRGIMGWAGVIPETERPTEFIRKVLPQDYLEKLAPTTIERLNATLADELDVFDYS